MKEILTTKIFGYIQDDLHAHCTTIMMQGSSRSSKTYNIMIALIVYLVNHPYRTCSVVRKTLPAIKGSVLRDFKEIMFRMGLYNERSMNNTDLIYHFPNGSMMEFFSTDNEQKLRGRKRHILFCNEANELSFLEYQQLKMRTSLFAILDFNPSFSDEHWLVSLKGLRNTAFHITTYKDNPFLEQTIIDEIESLQFKNKTLWQVYGLGQQAIIEGLVFEKVEVIDSFPDNLRRVFLGMDFGFHPDPTGIVRVGVTEDALYLHEICYETEMMTEDIIRKIKDQRLSPAEKVISESADPRLVEGIYRAGVNIFAVKKYAGSVEAGVQTMRGFKIYVTRQSYNLLKELHNYVFSQDKEGKWLSTPVDAYNHLIDAARYVVLEEVMAGTRKPINLKRLSSSI